MTSATKAKVVELSGFGPQHEAEALGNITPGMLVERGVGGVQAHATAAGPANLSFANEYGLTGRTIDDVYETGDQVIFTNYVPGSNINALLADGVDAQETDLLVSNGDGTLKVLVVAEGGTVVAEARESVDNSGGASAVRIRVEVIPAAYVAPVA